MNTVVGLELDPDFSEIIRRDEISLLEEELVRSSVKNSLIVPSSNLTFLCSVWTRKTYNLVSFHLQLKITWKTKGKLEIQVARKNLYLITFDNEVNLATILEERPWLFRKQLILFDRIENPMERSKF